MMKNNLATNLAPMGIFSELLNDNTCFTNGTTLEAIINSEAVFLSTLLTSFLCFFTKIEKVSYIEHALSFLKHCCL
jgi:hypothetical protein